MKKILILWLFLITPQAYSDNLSDSNQLFNWAEDNYPQYFNPPNETTFKIENYLVRYYEKTDIYIGTLGADVYVYGKIFNGLIHVGSIGDFINLSNNEMKIVGNDEFITQTEAALALLKDLVPTTFEKVQQYIGTIEQGEFSHIWVYEESPRYQVSEVDAFYSIKWYAGTIAHEAVHSELYHQYQAKHGTPVPADIWSSLAVEKQCIDYQIEVMKKMNAPQFDINYLNGLDGTGTSCNIDGFCE